MSTFNDFPLEAVLAEMGLTVDDNCVVLNELDHDGEIFQLVHKGPAVECVEFIGNNPDKCTHITTEEDFIDREPEKIIPS